MTGEHTGHGLHETVVPIDVRETDAVHARIKSTSDSGNKFFPVRVWRLSPLGIELVQIEQGPKFARGESIDLQIIIGGRRADFHGLVIDETNNSESEELFGVRFFSTKPREYEGDTRDERSAQRWLCSEEYVPRAIAPAPGRFNEFIGFKIRDISRQGLLLTTQLSNSFLIPGMKLNLSVHLPMVSETIIPVQIVRIQIGKAGAEELLEVGVVMINPTNQLLTLLGQYLIQFSQDSSIEELVSEGLVPDNVSLGIEFYPLKDESDYLAALALRKMSAKVATDTLISFADEKDRKARVIVGKVGSKIVATARVRYPAATDRLLCEPEFVLSASEGRADELIEVSGIGIDVLDEYRNDALLALIRYICSSCISAERHRVLVICDEKDSLLFRKAGWACLHRNDSVVLLTDAYRAIQGDRVNLLYWNFVWRSVAEYLIEAGVLEPKGVDRIVLGLFKRLAFLSNYFFKFKRRAAKIRQSIES